jgi:hypothetical protein
MTLTDSQRPTTPPHVIAYMLTCQEREPVREQTIANLSATDWPDLPVLVLDEGGYQRKQERQERATLRVLTAFLDTAGDVLLFLEDDLEFNTHLAHNLALWPPLRSLSPEDHFFGSLYNPNICPLASEPGRTWFLADPEAVYGSQAFLLARRTVEHLASQWFSLPGGQDIKMSRLAAHRCPLHYHRPSLVEHVGQRSTWGGRYHTAVDFHREWRATRPDHGTDGL